MSMKKRIFDRQLRLAHFSAKGWDRLLGALKYSECDRGIVARIEKKVASMLYANREEVALSEIEAWAMYRALEVWCKDKNTEEFSVDRGVAMMARFRLLGDMWRKCHGGAESEFFEKPQSSAERLSTEELLDELTRRGINLAAEGEADDKEVSKRDIT
jgi:hypothetical protein